jgi:hypothetical protein
LLKPLGDETNAVGGNPRFDLAAQRLCAILGPAVAGRNPSDLARGSPCGRPQTVDFSIPKPSF